MKYLVCLAALLTAAQGSPLQERQLLNITEIEDAPKPTKASVPIGVVSDLVEYDLPAATQSATQRPLPMVTGAEKRDVLARSACDPQPTGAGPVPSPDTASAFMALSAFAATASAAPVPSGYTQTFKNLQGSSQAYGYMGFTLLDSYDTETCAAKCNSITGCVGINVYFERDPSLEPGDGCNNPPSTTAIKCVFWGGYLSAAGATNTGQWRSGFQVIIAGSNAYMSNTVKQLDGFTGAALGNAAINAPLDCNGADTYMGVKTFSNSYFDPSLCAAACVSQNVYNTEHPTQNRAPDLCRFFTTYMISKNGVPQGQYCAMYTEPWSTEYATNVVSISSSNHLVDNVNLITQGQYAGSDHYTVEYGFSYYNTTTPGYPQCN
jgi:hypothetical protein